MLNLRRRRRIVAVLPTDQQLRGALGLIATWQRSLRCGVRVILVGENERLITAEAVQRFRQWAADVAQLELSDPDVDVCGSDALIARIEQLGSAPGDLLICPANASGELSLQRIPFGALWSQVAQGGASILLGHRKLAARRVLVLTDGTPRTLPVLQSAFELAEQLDVQMSHLDSLKMPIPWRIESTRAGSADVRAEGEAQDGYLRIFKRAMTAVGRAQRDLRPDLLLVGAPKRDRGGAILAALGASLLPCSVLVVPV